MENNRVRHVGSFDETIPDQLGNEELRQSKWYDFTIKGKRDPALQSNPVSFKLIAIVLTTIVVAAACGTLAPGPWPGWVTFLFVVLLVFAIFATFAAIRAHNMRADDPDRANTKRTARNLAVLTGLVAVALVIYIFRPSPNQQANVTVPVPQVQTAPPAQPQATVPRRDYDSVYDYVNAVNNRINEFKVQQEVRDSNQDLRAESLQRQVDRADERIKILSDQPTRVVVSRTATTTVTTRRSNTVTPRDTPAPWGPDGRPLPPRVIRRSRIAPAMVCPPCPTCPQCPS